MKQNSLVICKCLPVVGGNLRNCFSYNYLLRTSLMVQWRRIFLRRDRVDPWSRKCPPATEQLRQCSPVAETLLQSPRAAAPEACTLEPEEARTARKPGSARKSGPTCHDWRKSGQVVRTQGTQKWINKHHKTACWAITLGLVQRIPQRRRQSSVTTELICQTRSHVSYLKFGT